MGEERVIFVRKATGLVREVGWFSAFCMALCHTVGGGINYFQPTLIYTYPRANVPVGFILGGIPMILLGIAMWLMSAAMPRTGGDYIYISRVLNPYLGFMSNWTFWIAEAMVYGLIAYADITFFGLLCWVVGHETGNTALMATGLWLQSPVPSAVFGSILEIIFFILGLLGTTVISWTMNILAILMMSCCFIMTGTLAFAPTWAPSLKDAWDAYFGAGAYDEVFRLAREAGWSENLYWPGHRGFVAIPTLGTMVPAIFAYWGLLTPVYMGSEVKEPSKSMFMGCVGSSLLVVIYYFINCYLFHSLYGGQMGLLIQAYNFAYHYVAAGKAEWKINPGLYMVFPMLTAPLYPNLAIRVIAVLQALFGLMSDIPAFQVVCSRAIFAWSFDRFFPEVFAAVNDRFGSPHWALLLTLIGGLIATYMALISPWLLMMLTTNMVLFRDLYSTSQP